MADTVGTIVSFLKAKGLPGAAIAAILGNMQTESSFSTSALNGQEGAIGLIQWEGGRRSALQQFAASQGKSETDLNTQLNFLWHELTTSYVGVLNQMKSAHDPGQAAAIWDAQYEVSSGSSRQQRINNALAFAKNGLSGVGIAQSSGGGGGGGGAVGTAVANSVALTPQQQKDALQSGAGPLYALAQAVPELAGLIATAISKGQSATEFQNSVTNSKWYKTHSDAVRSAITLQKSDPATYAANRAKELVRVQNMATSLGVNLGHDALGNMTNAALMNGWDDATLQKQLGSQFDRNGKLGGKASQIYDQLAQSAQLYGQGDTWGDQTLRYRTQQVLGGGVDINTYLEQMKTTAKAMYPGLSAQIDQGLTVHDVAAPYLSSMANLLEVNPTTLGLDNPLVKKALQGTGAVAKGQVPTAMPLWQFEQQVKSDPKWQFTKNAMADTASTLTQLGKQWGMES